MFGAFRDNLHGETGTPQCLPMRSWCSRSRNTRPGSLTFPGHNAAQAAEPEALAVREGLALHPLQLDVTDEASVTHAVEEVLAQYGRVDVLVNNAGYGIVDLAESVTV